MNTLKKICPVCALVALTWLTMLVLKWLGYPTNNELIAMLMGGSVVGIAYVLGTRLRITSPMLWKLISIPLGFITLYALLQFAWGYFLGGLTMYVLVWTIFQATDSKQNNVGHVEDITKKLDSCCT